MHEELYYTERLMSSIDNAAGTVVDFADTEKIISRVAANSQTYSRILDTPVESVDAFQSEAQVLRFRLGKSYTQINQLIDAQKRLMVVVFAGLATLIIVLSLVWGYRNTQKAIKKANSAKKSWGFSFSAFIVIAIVFIVFSLPIFRIPSQEIESASAEEQERQAAMDNSQRAAGTADKEASRAWMLSRVGAEWHKYDPEKADEILDEALEAAKEMQINADALWGESQSAREAAGGEEAAQDKARLIASQMDAVRNRGWALRLIAQEWLLVDKERSAEILEQAQRVSQDAIGIYRDLDLRGIAVTWAEIDTQQALIIALQVQEPALQAWGLREIAQVSGDDTIYKRAIKAAQRVRDPVQRARSLREIAVSSGDQGVFAEALEALSEAEGVGLAYGLSDLAGASGDVSIAEKIDPAYPAAQAAAFYRLGEFQRAWEATLSIQDSYERARAQAQIAGSWGDLDAAQSIDIALYRDLALRDVIINLRDVSLVQEVQSAYYRVQIFTALEQYQAASDAAVDLYDYYPLVALSVHLAEGDPSSALALVPLMDRESDKAVALRAIAASTNDQDVFDQALGMANAARVRGDALAPANASLYLGQALELVDPQKAVQSLSQALEITRLISIKYR